MGFSGILPVVDILRADGNLDSPVDPFVLPYHHVLGRLRQKGVNKRGPGKFLRTHFEGFSEILPVINIAS